MALAKISGSLVQGSPSVVPNTRPPTKITSELQGTIRIVEPGPGAFPEQLFSFLSTFLWVGLIVGVLLVYRAYVRTFLVTVIQRLQEGSSLELLYFKLGVRPQTPTQQRARIDEEVAQVALDTDNTFALASSVRNAVRSAYLAAEDLAIREIQSEFGAPISRQIETSGAEFDGIFSINGIVYLIEVKLVRSEKNDAVARRSVSQLSQSIASLSSKNVRGVLAVVYDVNFVNLSEQRRRLLRAAENLPVSIDIRCYHLAELRAKYGEAGG